MSETSRLFEQISERLLDESVRFPVEIGEPSSADSRETPVELENPFAFDDSGLKPAGFLDLEDFFKLAADIVEDAQNREGIVASQQVKVLSDFPNQEMRLSGDELITYKVRSRTPAKMNANATGRPQLGSLYSHEVHSPKHPNKVIYVETQPIDHVIEFSVWARSAQIANRRALWLERLFKWHKFHFILRGADRFYWKGRGSDTIWTPHSQRIHQRPLTFEVRLVECELKAHPILRQIAVEILTGS